MQQQACSVSAAQQRYQYFTASIYSSGASRALRRAATAKVEQIASGDCKLQSMVVTSTFCSRFALPSPLLPKLQGDAANTTAQTQTHDRYYEQASVAAQKEGQRSSCKVGDSDCRNILARHRRLHNDKPLQARVLQSASCAEAAAMCSAETSWHAVAPGRGRLT